jgi:hypothetical protein
MDDAGAYGADAYSQSSADSGDWTEEMDRRRVHTVTKTTTIVEDSEKGATAQFLVYVPNTKETADVCCASALDAQYAASVHLRPDHGNGDGSWQ